MLLCRGGGCCGRTFGGGSSVECECLRGLGGWIQENRIVPYLEHLEPVRLLRRVVIGAAVVAAEAVPFHLCMWCGSEGPPVCESEQQQQLLRERPRIHHTQSTLSPNYLDVLVPAQDPRGGGRPNQKAGREQPQQQRRGGGGRRGALHLRRRRRRRSSRVRYRRFLRRSESVFHVDTLGALGGWSRSRSVDSGREPRPTCVG